MTLDLVMPLPEDRFFAATATEPDRVFFADGSHVALRADEDRTGTTYGIMEGPRALQAVIWKDGTAALVGIEALERLAPPAPLSAQDIAKRSKRVEMFAARFLAETPEHAGHPGPIDRTMAQRFANCGKPAPRELYPRIRAEILRILADRAKETTPGAPTVLVEYVPLAGPRLRVLVAVGNRLMESAGSSNAGAISRVTAIADTEHYGLRGRWVSLMRANGKVVHWLALEITRFFTKVD
jgi:hypothetical protein